MVATSDCARGVCNSVHSNMGEISAINKCNWDVLIRMCSGGERFYWIADSSHSGIDELESAKHFKTKILALKDWARFARVNGIKQWFCMTEMGE